MSGIQEQLAVKLTPDFLKECNIPGKSSVFYFPQGIVGFTELKSFILLPIEKEEYAEFRRLQSLDNPDIAFFLYNLKGENKLVMLADLKQGAMDLNIPYEMTDIYGICTLTKINTGQCEFRINLRAPLILDRLSNEAYQYIYLAKEYDYRHFLGVY